MQELREAGYQESRKQLRDTNWQEYRKVVNLKTGETKFKSKSRLKTLDIMIDAEK